MIMISNINDPCFVNAWNIANQALKATQFDIIATINPKDKLWHS